VVDDLGEEAGVVQIAVHGQPCVGSKSISYLYDCRTAGGSRILSAMTAADPYRSHHVHLLAVHAGLLDRLRALGAQAPAPAPPDDRRAAVAGYAMLAHHHLESAVLFPHLRRAGRLHTTDAARLDACDRDHAAIHDLATRLRDAPDAAAAAVLAAELVPRFTAHVAEEEVALAPDRLREMITAEQLAAVGRELDAARLRLAVALP
jgi:hypothetical protein